LSRIAIVSSRFAVQVFCADSSPDAGAPRVGCETP
jgi:hypothetical protein